MPDFETFFEITGAEYNEAQRFLAAGTTLEGAIEDYFAAQAAGGESLEQDEEDDELADELMADDNEDQQGQTAGQGAARTLGGQAVDTTLPEGWGRQERRTGRVGDWTGDQPARRPGGIATLFNTGLHPSAGGGGGGGGGMPGGLGPDDDDDDDSDDEERRRGETLYAGGERSGLAVQNPDQPGRAPRGIVDNILRQAADNSRERESVPAPGGPSVFRGAGNVLGSEDTPADEPAAPAPTAGAGGAGAGLLGSLLGRFGGPPPPEEEVQTRRLTFWSDGFSIEDGPLHAYDAPGNRELLEAIQAGRAPPSLFNVRYNQPIQIEVAQRTNEAYRPPPKVSRPFEGSGNRLGSPTPEVVSGTQTPNMPGGMRSGTPLGTRGDSGPNAAAGQGQNGFEVDPSKPTTNVQIRLGDGTRIVAKVNLTHRVGDLKNFVAAARPDNRPFLLQTTFPSKELDNPNLTIEEAKLQNAVVVQRFT